MRVKPADGRLVRDPVTKRHIPAEGADVPDTVFWFRRLASGDVVHVVPITKTAPAAEDKK